MDKDRRITDEFNINDSTMGIKVGKSDGIQVTNEIIHIPQTVAISATKRKKRGKKTNVACINCSKWHVSCDSSRPCKRCMKKGIAETCIDAPRKRSKYLAGIPTYELPLPIRKENVQAKSVKHGPHQLNNNNNTKNNSLLNEMPQQRWASAPNLNSQFFGQGQERQHFYNPQHIIHTSKFLSNAAGSEYSMLSNIIQQDNLVNRVPVDNMLYRDAGSPHNINIINNGDSNNVAQSIKSFSSTDLTANKNSSGDNSNNNTPSSHTSPDKAENDKKTPCTYSSNLNGSIINNAGGVTISPQKYPSSFQNVYSILLGPHSNEIINAKVNLFVNHFALVPVESPDNSLAFKRLIALDPAIKHGELQKNTKINQYYLNNETLTFPEVLSTYETSDNMKVSFALECSSPELARIRSNPEWRHSLRYSTPMEIYTMIDEPFSHTPGFRHLLLYLRSRFNKKDIVEMCRSMAEFRPIFIACSVTLTEEDMIFMEQCYQRTLLEYAKFLEQIGTPTCVWRRNGQISYVNEEFEILTGWKREELLNKMTFIVEILDDDSVRDYFKTFSSVAYKDFKGSEKMQTCRILSPIKDKVINCCCMWTLKRDISGLPLMILANFMPIL